MTKFRPVCCGFLLVLCLSSLVFGQGASYTGTPIALTRGGLPAAGATVTVCSGNVATNVLSSPPCSPYASIYSDPALAVPITQPGFKTDGLGNYPFFVAAGSTYTVCLTGSGFTGSCSVWNSPAVVGGALNVTSFNSTNTATTDFTDVNIFEQGLNPSVNSTLNQFGQTTEIFSYKANSKNFSGAQIGVYGSWSHFGSGTEANGYGLAGEAFNSGPGTATLEVGVSGTADCGGVAAGNPIQTPTNNGNCTNLRGFDGVAHNSSSGTVGSASALYANTNTNTGGGTITNNYGLFVADQAAGVNNWSIFTGAGLAQFGGDVFAVTRIGIGTAAPDSTTALWVQPPTTDFTGTTQYGIRALPLTNTLATVFGIGIGARVDTQNGAFTQTRNAAFYAGSGVKGAASTITNAYGLYVDTITNGANNFGVYTAGSAKSEFDGGIQAGISGSLIADTRELLQSVHTCGTTTTCANTANGSYREVFGTVTLSTGAATLSSITAFTSTATFGCTCTDQTAANACKAVPASSSSVTFAGTGSDVLFYRCVGN